jgi:mono/diheme cytochrome c family protein
MSTPERKHVLRLAGPAFAALLLAACAAQPPAPKSLGLGTGVTPVEAARWDISIPPSGAGLPAGSGHAGVGVRVYEQKCLACHGVQGLGKPADALVGGIGTLKTQAPLRTVGSYWPYATTLFDYIRRAMPITNPLSLTNDEVYAVSAYLLFLNGIIDEDLSMDAQTLPQVKMPNRDGFVDMSTR